jgi:mono/diheme cytochrome c family protein
MERLRARCTWIVSTIALLAAAASAAEPDAPPSGSELRFLRDGTVVGRVDREGLERSCSVQTVEIDDPYYGTRKSFRACPLGEVLALGFGKDAVPSGDDDVFLRARDGYVKTVPARVLREAGGYLALADAAHARDGDPGWQPIDRRQVDPGPYYLVWAKPEQRDVHRYPWPYQLVAIETSSFARAYPHTLPATAPAGSPPWAGFAIFRNECISCHAINGEGGKVGPDLNVPRSIVEYRPVEQIKAFVRDPRTFRYTSMPAHPDLSAADLDGLIAYFDVMKTLKHDPGHAP